MELAQVRVTLEVIEKWCESTDGRPIKLQEQIKVKDEDLGTKGNCLEKLADIMRAQAIHLQTLVNQKGYRSTRS